MGWFSPIHKLVLRNGGNRPELRRHRKHAANGDLAAYCELISPYIDLVTEYLYFTGYTCKAELAAKAGEAFANVWTRLPYTQRLSDFERLLALSLKSVPAADREFAKGDILAKTAFLTPDRRFILVGRELEAWHEHWLGLACRRKPEGVLDLLAEVRATLTGIEVEGLTQNCRSCLNAISRDIDQGCDLKTRMSICEKMASMPQIKGFKAKWLELRCEMIELRQQTRFEQEERERLLHSVVTTLSPSEMLHPQLVHRLKNTIHFENFPEVSAARQV